MPKIKIPDFLKSSNTEDGNTACSTDSKVSILVEQPKPFNFCFFAPNSCSKTVAVTVSRNPSTIFKPPFGTNVDEHHSRLGEHTQHLWRCKKITDLTVKLHEVQYPCHKTVLSCYSKYFKDLLLNEDKTANVIHLKLPGVTNRAFEVLLSYMYTSNLDLTCQNIDEVYTAARKLGVDGALILCRNILTGKSKHNVNSVYVYVTSKKHQLREKELKALETMAKRFEQIVGTPEFLDLDFPQVKEYLSQDVLGTRSEVVVYLAALKWLNVKFLEREQYAADLMGCVRFQMMTLNEILACFSPPMLPGILELKEIRDRLLTATCYVAAVTVNEDKRFGRYACRPRKYLLERESTILWDTSIYDPDRHAMYAEEMAATAIQAVFRGYKARKSIEADKAAGILRVPDVGRSLKSNMAGLDEFSRPVEGDDLSSNSGSKHSIFGRIRKSIMSFMAGSEEDNGTSEENQTSKKLDNWAPNNPFAKTLRRSSSTDTLVGHVNNVAENTEIKKYTSDTAIDISSEAFQKTYDHARHENVPRVHTRPNSGINLNQESDLSQIWKSDDDDEENRTSNVSANGYILATGGFRLDDAEDNLEGKAMFLYNSSTDEWKKCGIMGKARHHHRIACLNKEIYFIGGCNPFKTKEGGGMIPEKTCFKFDPKSKKWNKISKMRHSRLYHGVAELDGKIYVVGGKDDRHKLLDSVEAYDPASNTWNEIQSIGVPMMGAAVCAHQGQLWVVGGMTANDEGEMSLLRDVKYYDPVKKRWRHQHVGQLPFPKAFSTIVSFENELYAIGGTSDLNGSKEEEFASVSDVMLYDHREKRWFSKTGLPFPRHCVEAAAIGTNLYVLGGFTSFPSKVDNELISYDKYTRKWRTHAPFPDCLCGFAAISV